MGDTSPVGGPTFTHTDVLVVDHAQRASGARNALCGPVSFASRPDLVDGLHLDHRAELEEHTKGPEAERTPMHRLPTASFHLVVGLAFLGVAHSAQTVAYDVEVLGNVPGADSTIPTGMNDLGEVVGWSQFFGSSTGLVGWRWSSDEGFTVLPQPFGSSTSRAIDINDAGVIAGDQGFDSGVAWRLEEGTYELLDTVGGYPGSYAAGIDASGSVAATAKTGSIVFPQIVFVNTPVGGSAEIVGDGYCGYLTGYLNDLGQVTGTATPTVTTIQAFRFTPGLGVELLGALGGRPLTHGNSINQGGDVVGYATQSNGNGSVPFLYTDTGGMQEIGGFGGGAVANDVNDGRVVVGTFDTSGPSRAWVWTASEGVRFLDDLVDPGTTVKLLEARRVNERGQILGYGFDDSVGDFRPFLLTRRGSQPRGGWDRQRRPDAF